MLLRGNLKGVQHLGIPVVDIQQAKSWYIDKLGFQSIHEPVLSTPDGDIRVAFLERHGLVIECYQLPANAIDEIRQRRDGCIDHLALDVLDVSLALQDALARGAALHETAAEGQVYLSDAWSQGIRCAFLRGPSGEKIELSQFLHLSRTRRTENVGGWSHLGIPAADLDTAAAFYRRFGFMDAMATTMSDGQRRVLMEQLGFGIELYEMPSGTALTDGHIDHIAFDVADIDAAYSELQSAGLDILEAAPVPLPFWEHGVKYFNLRGPGGEKLEFNQRLG